MPHGVPAQKTYLFTDLRHILCSDLQYLGPDGKAVPLQPKGAPVEVHTDTFMMPHGIRLAAQPATEGEPIPPPGVPTNRVLFDQGMYRAWGMRPVEAGGRAAFDICVSESNDGFTWKQVHTCRFPSPGGLETDELAVFVDPHAPAAERYKGVFCIVPPEERWAGMYEEYTRVHRHHRIWRLSPSMVLAVYGATSPDGLDWTLLPEHLMVHFSDTDTSVYYDETLEQYVMYTRLMFQQRRWIGRAVSNDFRRWGPVEPILGPTLEESPTNDLYQNGFFRYPYEPAYFLMLPMIYHRWDQSSDIHLFSSEDGIYWNRLPGGPVIAHGAENREYLGIVHELVPMPGDRLAIRYAGTPYPHKYPRWPHVLKAVRYWWAYWPKGRLAAVQSDEEGGFFTFPLEAAGRSLRLNARIAKTGEIRVGIVDQPGRSVRECDPIVGDGLSLPVHWKGEEAVGVERGQPITLEFRLRSARLFGFDWV